MIATSTAEPIAAALRRAAASGVTSVLRVEVPGDVGYVFLHEGQVVHASTVDLEGEAAATSICGWESGLLTWCERRWPARRSVPSGWSPPLLEVAEPPPAVAATSADARSEEALPELTPVVESTVHFPSAFGIRRVLGHTVGAARGPERAV